MPDNGLFFDHPPVSTQKSGMLVQGLFRRNRQSMAGGYPGDGKTLVGQFLFHSIAYEAPFANKFPVTGGNIMLIDSENEWDILKNHAEKIKKGLEMDGYTKRHRIWWEYRPQFLLEDDKTWQPIMEKLDDVKPVIISLDHLARFHLLDENLTHQMERVNKGNQALMDRQGSSLHINHHLNKKDKRGSFFMRLRGSSALLANTDIAFEVRAISRKRIGEEIYLEKVGLIFQPRKEPTPPPMILRIEEGKDYMKLHYEGDYQPIDDPQMDRIHHDIFHIFLKIRGRQSVNDIKDSIEGYASDKEIRDSLRGLEDRNLLTKKIAASGKYIYQLATARCPWCFPGKCPEKLKI